VGDRDAALDDGDVMPAWSDRLGSEHGAAIDGADTGAGQRCEGHVVVRREHPGEVGGPNRRAREAPTDRFWCRQKHAGHVLTLLPDPVRAMPSNWTENERKDAKPSRKDNWLSEIVATGP